MYRIIVDGVPRSGALCRYDMGEAVEGANNIYGYGVKDCVMVEDTRTGEVVYKKVREWKND